MNKITKKPEQIEEVSKVGSENADGSTTEAGTAAEKRQGQTSESVTPKELSSEEKATLKASEQTITQNLRGGWELAKALTEISEKRLYRGEFETFRKYCLLRWRLSYRRVHQLVTALAVRQHIASACETELPETECQVRPLTLLKDTDLQTKAWESAWSKANRQPTGDEVKEAVEALAPRKPYRSREAKVTGMLNGLKAMSKVAAGVDDGLTALLKEAVARATVLQKSQEEKPSKGRKAKS